MIVNYVTLPRTQHESAIYRAAVGIGKVQAAAWRKLLMEQQQQQRRSKKFSRVKLFKVEDRKNERYRVN
jgi:hypothetical protein